MAGRLYAAQYAEWIAYGVILPVGMVVAGYVLALFLQVHDPFRVVFGTAELLLVAVLFLIPVVLELDKPAIAKQISYWHKPALIVVIIFATLFYGTLKTYALKVLHTKIDPAVSDLILAIGIFTIIASVACGLYACLLRYEIMTVAAQAEGEQ